MVLLRPEDKCILNERKMEADSVGYQLSHPPPGEEVVIAGMAGFFPECDSVQELQNNLFNKVDMVTRTQRGWKVDHPEMPQSTGKINRINKFDAQFFGVHFKHASYMDPMCRMVLEKTYEALIDAGVNPRELRDTKTGVFVGVSTVEAERTAFYNNSQSLSFALLGCSRTMLANRISYWLGTTGPSYTIDTACSSSMTAVEQAFRAIRNGLCESAIVGGTNLHLHPYISMQYHRLGFVSSDGKTKSFDKNADGYSRADAVSVLYLQKGKSARRVYAQVVYAKGNCDGRYPAGTDHIVTEPALKHLLDDCYKECSILPTEVEYVEAHGSGILESDLRELRVIDQVFAKDRTGSVLIGSIKSNMGNSEAAAGICSITKACLAYQSGYIAPNLHYSQPADVDGLQRGRLQVVTEKTPWNRGYIAVSNFGFGGVNAHVVLKNYAKPKVNGAMATDDLPRLVCASGRSEDAIDRILDDLRVRPLDVEQVRLLHAIHENEIPGHVYRGYSLLAKGINNGPAVSLAKEHNYFPGAKRPIWFIYSGMGSQWSGMGAQLMRLPVFAEAIHRCDEVLSPRGLDITRIITDPDPHMFDNILHSFVGIAAVQIGLTNVLRAVGIVPDNIIGHSVGELGCAYADGCFSAEQMILAAYSRGLASIETPFIKGSMAAVGLGYNEVKKLCPAEIEVACHNGPGSSTISGPADAMKVFVSDLKAKGIFAREVPCSNIAYHSRYIAKAGPTLLKYLKEVIPSAKSRSARWMSTSVPQGEWGEERARYSSAEYHTNNLLRPVLFEETSRLIPFNAITIEIAPHGLLQAILRPTLHKDCTNIPLTKRGHPDNVEFMFTALGKLYQEGLNLQLSNLYPRVEFPVSAGTPMLSHLVRWEHSEDWFVPLTQPMSKVRSGERHVRFCLVDDEWTYMAGHVIDDVNIFPASGYLVLVWETLGFILDKPYNSFSVVFEDVTFKKTSTLSREGEHELSIMIQKGTGIFEVIENDESVVTGRIEAVEDASSYFSELPTQSVSDELELDAASVYKDLAVRGYSYSGEFQSILGSDLQVKQALLRWGNNWVTFVDSLLQLSILATAQNSGDIITPRNIGKMIIDVDQHRQILSELPGCVQTPFIQAAREPQLQVLRAGGVEIRNLQATVIQRRSPLQTPTLQKFKIISHYGKELIKVEDALRLSVQLAVENHKGGVYKVVELTDPLSPDSISSTLEDFLEKTIDFDFEYIATDTISAEANAQLVIGHDLLMKPGLMQKTWGAIKDGGFILSRERSEPGRDLAVKNIDIITSKQTETDHFVLFRKRQLPTPQIKFISVTSDDGNFGWFSHLQAELAKNSEVVLVSENQQSSGITGLVKSLRKKQIGASVSALIISDFEAPAFNGDLPLYRNQLDKGLAINQYQNGHWCSYIGGDITASVESSHAQLVIQRVGNLSSLAWVQGELASGQKLEQDDEIVQVYYAGVSYRDVMSTTGRIPVDAPQKGYLGYEFSGRLSNCDRVMGVVPCGGLSTSVQKATLLWPVPANWSLEDAATVPVAYTLAFYALLYRGQLKPNYPVLIHSGAGALGQAAINVCLHYQCTVFTTVGSQEKRDFIRRTFPQIKDSHIGSSRDANFDDIVKHETKGHGVRLVIYTLSEDIMYQESVNCLSDRGIILNLSQFDIHNNSTLRMGFLIKEAHCHTISLNTIGMDEMEDLQKAIAKGIDFGIVRPLHRTVFTTDETEAAFRQISTRKNLGRVLIEFRQEEEQMIVKPTPHQMLVRTRYFGDEHRSYVVVGGLNGLGLELADWLVCRGVRNIVLHSQSELTNGYQKAKLQKWRSSGVSVSVLTMDISNEVGCSSLLQEANELAPVRAIFLALEPVEEVHVQEPTADHLARIVTPKVAKANYLDVVSRKLCPELEEFVVFVKTCSAEPAAALGDSRLEEICARRRARGLAGTAVRWSALGEASFNIDGDKENVEGTLLQSVRSALDSLDTLLYQNASLVSSAMLPRKRTIQGNSTIMEEVAKISGLDYRTTSPHLTLGELGLDTPSSVEVACFLRSNFQLHLTPTNVKKLTFSKLSDLEEQRKARQTNIIGNDIEGINMFLRHVVDEFSASEHIIDLPTAVDDSDVIEETRYTSGLTMYLVPGLDGASCVFQSVCRRLKARATVYQLGVDLPHESVQDIANRLARHMLSHLAPESNFYIVGYSFGVQVALEIATALENEGHKGKIFCLDGSPDYFKALMGKTVGGYSDDALEDIVICRIHELLTSQTTNDLQKDLQNCRDLTGKIEMFLKRVPSSVKLSKEYQRGLIKVALNRIHATKSYGGAGLKKLRSEIVLLRIKDEVHRLPVDQDYGLGKYSEQQVKVYVLEGNHVTIADNQRCSTILNNEMSECIDLKSVNSCLNYLCTLKSLCK